MTTWDDLPRDLHIRIVKHLDIDARIKTCLIGRLRIPASLKCKHGRIVQGRTKVCAGDLVSSSTEVHLGSRCRFPWAPTFMAPIYMICFMPDVKGSTEHSWRVLHYIEDKLHSHGLDPIQNKWTLLRTT
jgi:hypothetical protein